MNILNLCSTDFAGLGIRITDAINKHSSHKARHLALSPHAFGYPFDIITLRPATIRKWVNWADVVNCWSNIKALELCKTFPEKLIWMFVGSRFRRNHRRVIKRAKELNAKMLVCTPDLQRYGKFEWLPNAVSVDEWFKMKKSHSGKPIVCQSPSSKVRKSTNAILKQISGKKNVKILIIHKVNWQECMRLKSKADIYVGDYTLGHGMSQLEAMAMKIPVISKLKPECEDLVIRAIGYLPHYNCPIHKLSEGIDCLLSDKKLYRKYSDLGFKYVRQFHDYPVVAKKFVSICEELMG